MPKLVRPVVKNRVQVSTHAIHRFQERVPEAAEMDDEEVKATLLTIVGLNEWTYVNEGEHVIYWEEYKIIVGWELGNWGIITIIPLKRDGKRRNKTSKQEYTRSVIRAKLLKGRKRNESVSEL